MKMKRAVILLVFMALLLSLSSCAGKDEKEVKKGIYFLKDEEMGPYVFLDPENMEWNSARGITYSYALAGTYSQNGDRITLKGADTKEAAMELQILSEEEIRVISVNDAFFPKGNRWINEGESYVFWPIGG